jgi:hypothetical protein
VGVGVEERDMSETGDVLCHIGRAASGAVVRSSQCVRRHMYISR